LAPPGVPLAVLGVITKKINTRTTNQSKHLLAPPGVPLCRSWCYHQENQRTNHQSIEAPFKLTRNSLKTSIPIRLFRKTGKMKNDNLLLVSPDSNFPVPN
jgi:hypothetical protein